MKYVLYDIMGNRINYIRDNMGKYGNIMGLQWGNRPYSGFIELVD